jgi:large subunit ribosomal protein L22e
LTEKIKVDGRVGNLGDTIKISQQGDGKIEIIAHNELSGRYLKWLSVNPPLSLPPLLVDADIYLVTRRTKKFLKKQSLRDWLRVVSTSKGVYELKFFNVVNEDADEDDE